MDSKAIKKENKFRRTRLSKTGNAREAIGAISKKSDTYILTFGQFSLIDSLITILEQTGPAHVDISTWTAASAHLEKSQELMEDEKILSLRLILDGSFVNRQPEYYYHMKKIYGDDCIRHIGTHAKFMLIYNDIYKIVVRTSMNLNENPRLENIEISEDENFLNFMKEIVDQVFSEIKVNTKSQLTPLLPGMEDFNSKKHIELVEPKTTKIKSEKLHEPRTSHTIKIL